MFRSDQHAQDGAREDQLSRLFVRKGLLSGWNISNQRQDSQEFRGRTNGSQQAKMFESAKFTSSYVVARQELMVFNKPLP